MTTITLTDRAADQVRELLAGVEHEQPLGLRVGVDSFGWTQRYRLSLGPGPGDGEVVVRSADLDLFVDDASAALVDGVRIDYVETGTGGGFMFHNPSAGRAGPGSGAGPGGRGPAAGRCPDGVDAGVWGRVVAAMDDIRPYLWNDGGDATVVYLDAGTVWIEMSGACSGCSAASVTVVGVIKQRLTAAVAEVTDVAVVG